jgi:hypothetical protein
VYCLADDEGRVFIVKLKPHSSTDCEDIIEGHLQISSHMHKRNINDKITKDMAEVSIQHYLPPGSTFFLTHN